MLRAIVRLALLTVVCLLATGAASVATACVCVSDNSLCEKRNSAKIFIADVVTLPGGEHANSARATVVEAIKGVKRGEVIDFLEDGSTCNYTFRNGARLLIFAFVADGVVQTSICEGNIEIGDVDAASLLALRNPRAPASIAGRLTRLNGEKPATTMSSIPVSTTVDGRRYQAQTNDDGEFVLRLPRGGRFTIAAGLPAGVTVMGDAERGAVAVERRTIQVDVDAGACKKVYLGVDDDTGISGRLRGEPGLALQSVPVEAMEIEQRRSYRSTTDAKGRFTFRGLKPGTYIVGINISSCRPLANAPYPRRFAPDTSDEGAARRIPLAALEHVDDVELAFSGRANARRLVVRAVNEHGQPLEGVGVTPVAQCDRWQPPARHQPTTGRDGTIALELFDGADWSLQVQDHVPHTSETGDMVASWLRQRCAAEGTIPAPATDAIDVVLTMARCLEREQEARLTTLQQRSPGQYIFVPARAVRRDGQPAGPVFYEASSVGASRATFAFHQFRSDAQGVAALPLRVGDEVKVTARLSLVCEASATVTVDADGRYRWVGHGFRGQDIGSGTGIVELQFSPHRGVWEGVVDNADPCDGLR